MTIESFRKAERDVERVFGTGEFGEYCRKLGGKLEREGTCMVTPEIANDLVEFSLHIGTNLIKPDGIAGLKTKTFNAYRIDEEKYIVTNHYGLDLVNAAVYADKKALKRDYPKGEKDFTKYAMPLLPS